MRTVAGGSSLQHNGSCVGIPGHLHRGDFDFALQLWIEESKLQCVQFIAYNLITFKCVSRRRWCWGLETAGELPRHPTCLRCSSALVYRMPTRSSSAVNSMVTPFSAGSWAGVFIMFGMMALLLLIADETHLEEAYGNLGPWSAALIFGTAGISWGSQCRCSSYRATFAPHAKQASACPRLAHHYEG